MKTKGRIIVVCDPDKVMLEQFCTVLERIGFIPDNLICTESIKDTIEFSESNDPDIIFIDMHMEEPGYSICSLIEKAGTQMHIPVVLMAYPNESIGPLRGVALKGKGFLPKPVRILSLQTKITNLLRERDLERSMLNDCVFC